MLAPERSIQKNEMLITERSLKPLTEKTTQVLTRGIKHWGLSGYSNFLSRIKFDVTGQERSLQSPTILYRHTLWLIIKKTSHQSSKYNICDIIR